MGVQLFKDGGFQVFDAYSIDAMLDAGWSLTPEVAEEVVEVVEAVKVVEEVVSAEPTIAEIVDIIGQLDPDNTEHWTSQDKPMVVAIETLLGKPLGTGQRNEAWEIYKAR